MAGVRGLALAVVVALPSWASAQPPASAATGIVADAIQSQSPEDIQISAACGSDGPYREVRIFGGGVGIWNRSVQFTVPRPLLMTLLKAFQDADFDRMPAVLGGTVQPVAFRRGPRVICQVSLTAGPRTKDVVQIEKGTQSKALWALATGILDLAEAHAGSGVTASSFADGLERIIAGQLAPHTLDVTIHHRPDAGGRRGASGWILRVDGGVATADDYGAPAGSPRRRRLRLSASEVTELARVLEREGAATLPGNVYFADYTDLRMSVLDREHQVQARQFAGMPAEAQARGRVPFERVLAALTALHRRVVEAGQPVP